MENKKIKITSIKLSDEEYSKIQQNFYINIKEFSNNFKQLQKNKDIKQYKFKYKEFSEFITVYQEKYQNNITTDLKNYCEKLTQSYLVKYQNIKCKNLILGKKKLILEKELEKYVLKGKGFLGSDFENISKENFENISLMFSSVLQPIPELKNITPKLALKYLINSCRIILKYYEIYKERTQEAYSMKSFLLVDIDRKENTSKLKELSPTNENLDEKNYSIINNSNILNNQSYCVVYNPMSININNNKIEQIIMENLEKLINDIIIIKNESLKIVEFVKDDKNNSIGLEKEISALKEEIGKKFENYLLLKKMAKECKVNVK